ncbi:hypothetical protein B0T20DRAFT_421627 [Sordaria brevicollis]|uniref:Secreted protein n=1 Tax=Sordaria brevicollis TaxID=83679 RepID=A0AAE0P3K5_SORBR|nr:hypothetical protein B0T20DRAFT_421627 [Sordaria brevicollis]
MVLHHVLSFMGFVSCVIPGEIAGSLTDRTGSLRRAAHGNCLLHRPHHLLGIAVWNPFTKTSMQLAVRKHVGRANSGANGM